MDTIGIGISHSPLCELLHAKIQSVDTTCLPRTEGCCSQLYLHISSPLHTELRSLIAPQTTLEQILAIKQVRKSSVSHILVPANAAQTVYNQYTSDGSCQVKCQDSYAFAILQGPDCWCSNYAPSDQHQTNLCDDPCPGFQSDWCGSTSAGLYGYIALKIAPSGTIGGASSSTQTFSSIASSSVSTFPSTRRHHDPLSSSISTSTSSTVETTPDSGASITTLTSVVTAQRPGQASSSTVEISSTVIDPASSATTSSTTVRIVHFFHRVFASEILVQSRKICLSYMLTWSPCRHNLLHSSRLLLQVLF